MSTHRRQKVRPEDMAGIAYSVDEAAIACRVSRPTMLKLVRNGEVGHKRIGKRIIISKQALEAFLNGEQK